MHVKVPHDRLGAIIGKNGETKKLLEKISKTEIKIDSESGSVEVTSKDPLMELRGAEVIKAIARGFSPSRAFHLLDDELLLLEIIEIPASTRDELRRISGRIIGRRGRTRNLMEELTGASISVYGKTIAVIGYPEQISVVRTALKMLIDGAMHSRVYSYLERKRKELDEV
jgi:ribosomal RNA assembly protein